MKYSEYKDSIYTYIADNVGGIPVIWTNQNSPRPSMPYILLTLTAIPTEFFPFAGSTDNSGNRSLSYTGQFLLSIQSHGEDSMDYLQTLQESFSTADGKVALHNLGLTIQNESDITELPTVIDKTIEPRWLYELDIGFCNSYIENVGVIETVEISGEINGAKTSPIITNQTIGV